MKIRVFLFSILMSSSAFASNFSGYAKIASNYIWRGLSFSENQPIVAMSGTYAIEQGFYASLYATNLKSSDSTVFEGTNTKEVDLTLGYSKMLNEFAFNIYASRYQYIHISDASAFEYSLAFSYKNTTLEYNYLPNWFGYETSSQYVRLTQAHAFDEKFSLLVGVGYDNQEKTFRKQLANGKWEGAGFTSYLDYFVTFQVNEANGFTYELSFTGTNRKLISYDTGAPATDGVKSNAKDETLTISLIKTF